MIQHFAKHWQSCMFPKKTKHAMRNSYCRLSGRFHIIFDDPNLCKKVRRNTSSNTKITTMSLGQALQHIFSWLLVMVQPLSPSWVKQTTWEQNKWVYYLQLQSVLSSFASPFSLPSSFFISSLFLSSSLLSYFPSPFSHLSYFVLFVSLSFYLSPFSLFLVFLPKTKTQTIIKLRKIDIFLT